MSIDIPIKINIIFFNFIIYNNRIIISFNEKKYLIILLIMIKVFYT